MQRITRVLGACVLVLSTTACERTAPPGRATIGPTDRYAAAARSIEEFIDHEMKDKALPALSIALVDGDSIVWSRGFGVENSEKGTPATAETVYRVGSVSKLFTDIGVMQLVEQGTLDLDAPVRRYLPEFAPGGDTTVTITLRQLMSHRSGLTREPPIGNYFVTDEPTLSNTVTSLNTVPLVYAPERTTKYSNAAIAVVGYVLEQTQSEAFAPYLKRTVLTPMGLTNANFERTPTIDAHLADGLMWTRHGRTFPAPEFQLGMSPAGSMYATMPELGQFLSVLFNGGAAPGGQILKRETLEQMWVPQFAPPGATNGFGLGFAVTTFKGHRAVRHGGAIYGFATELLALPDERLGVAVSTSKDFANSVAERIAEHALAAALAARAGESIPTAAVTRSTTREEARAWAGRYGQGERSVELVARDTVLFMTPTRGGFRARLRWSGTDSLMTDDEGSYGTLVTRARNGGIVADRDTLARASVGANASVRDEWRGLIGEYGWDHNILYVYEQDGRMYALIEWLAHYPLTQVSADEFHFPEYGLYAGERLVFTRNAQGKATEVVAAEVRWQRRSIPGEDVDTYKTNPVRPVAELRTEALAATPPVEQGTFRDDDLVELTRLDPRIKLDVRYATDNNFLGTPVYSQARAFLQRPAAEATVRAQMALAKKGYGLMIHDGYRPWYVTKIFWDATPEKDHLYVADPSQGSRHNRGCAVDLTLYELATGRPVQMVGLYDEASDRSWPDYPGGTTQQRMLREILRDAMENEGFTVYDAEWWHFDYKDWREYRIGNTTFEALGR